MYNNISKCRVCVRRVLKEQLDISVGGISHSCIYCLMQFCAKELTARRDKNVELLFAIQLLEQNYTDLLKAYEGALIDNDDKTFEISTLRIELLSLRNNKELTNGTK